MPSRAAWGVGIATLTTDGRTLDAWYGHVSVDASSSESILAAVDLTAAGSATLHADAVDMIETGRIQAAVAAAAMSNVTALDRTHRVPVVTFIEDLAAAPIDAFDVYLRLHLLSHRAIRPHDASLEGSFGLLSNVAWTDHGPVEAERVDDVRAQLRAQGQLLRVTSVDKFPRMTDYVVPSGVRIADADRVRLGAHLAPGTTVMHEGFVNFNAGTLGASMVEGRISAGVVLGDGSDLGGGASIMGTLSGGGTEVISIGERCLIGANAGLGISLGDDCVVEAGLYVTAGTKVTLPDGAVVKARALSGQSNLLLRRDSISGAVVALTRDGAQADWGGLNVVLHDNG